MKVFFIGAAGNQTVTSIETRKQIEAIKQLECDLMHGDKQLSWKDFDNPDEERTIFRSIEQDRKIRIDEKTLMADRPSFAVVTEHEGKAIRVEYYEGHDALALIYDVRSEELEGKELPNFMDSDPNAYDPVEFLKDIFGMPEDFTRPIIDEIHKDKADQG